MNRLLILPVLLLTLLVGNPAYSADWNKGVAAYQSGDYATALREWTPLAEQGDASIQILVGSMYNEGKGVPQNDKTAVKWYRLAAKQGYARAHAKSKKLKGISRRIAREIARKKERIAREKQSASNPGFRDLKPGLHRSTIKKQKVCEGSLEDKSGTHCYDIDNLKFSGTFDKFSFLDKLTVNLGPIVGSVGLIDKLSTYIQKGETNIYLKMRTAFVEKYKLDFEYSERDRQLFNKDKKKVLYTVYEKGHVALLISRKKKGYSRELWLYIEYRDVKPAQIFFKSTKPKRAKKSDF